MKNNEEDIYEIKKSPYEGINNPEIRKQYEKEFNRPNYGLIISLILIFTCSFGYIFLISDTFSTIEIDNEEINNTINNIEIETEINLDDLDNIDINSLEVIDNTNKISNEKIIQASYIIKDLDYNYDSLKVPYINLNTDGANEVNEEIKNNYKTWAKESAKIQKAYANTSLDTSQVVKTQYYVFTHDDIMSVVISYAKRDNGFETYTYYAYAFNLSNNEILISTTEQILNGNDSINEKNYGKKLTYQELLVKLNFSYETIDTAFKEILKQYSGEYGEAKNIEDTLNIYNEEKENGSLNAFIDNEGRLNLISKIYTPLYENGTYRIFVYNGEKFESISNLNQETNKEVKP